jgi:hypothetical protein
MVDASARFRVAASELFFKDDRGGSLADRLHSDSDADLGAGCFGKVGAFMHHGAAVAVKELKSGTLDAGSIGALSCSRALRVRACVCFRSCDPAVLGASALLW